MYEFNGYIYPGNPKPILKVIYAETTPDFHLIAQFNDGEIRDYDMAKLFDDSAYSLLNDEKTFSKMKLLYGVPNWYVDDMEIDIAPEAIYEDGTSLDRWPAREKREA